MLSFKEEEVRQACFLLPPGWSTYSDIEKAAQCTCTEGPHGPRFKTVPNAGSSPEEETSGRMRA